MSKIRKRDSRVPELTRLVLMTAGGFLLTWLSSYAFQQDLLLGGYITKDPDSWREIYGRWSTWVCIASTISTIGWYGFASIQPIGTPEENLKMKLPWSIFSLPPLLAVLLFVFLFPFQEMKIFCVFLLLSLGVGGYWLGTSLNSPKPFQFIPLVSKTLRSALKIK